MKKLFLILFAIPFLFSFQSENDLSFSHIKTIETKADFITTDNLGNLYIIKNDVLEKYNSKGDLLKTYSNKSLGKIEQVDASNAMKIVVFYKNFRQVLLLDNMLAPVSETIRLDNYNLEQSTLICISHTNGIWFFDNTKQSLVRMDNLMQKTVETLNLNNMIGEELAPNYMLEANNLLYLNNPNFGIYVFDVFGSYFKTIPIKNLNSFQVTDGNIVYYKDNQLYTYNSKLIEESSFEIPIKEVISARAEKNLLFIQKEKSVEIYSVGKK